MQTRRNILIILLLFTAAITCYNNVINAGFIWDDEQIVSRNPLIRAPILSFQIFKQDIINSSFIHTVYYRPIQILSYAIDYRLWGPKAPFFHLVNILLHFLNSLLVFFWAKKLTTRDDISLFTALLFVIHPAYTGAVSYISGRADLLFFLFGFVYLILFILFLETRRYKFLVLSTFALLISLLCKEMAMIFPCLLFLLGIMRLRKDLKFKLLYEIPSFILAGGYIILHFFFFSSRYNRIFRFDSLGAILMKFFGIMKEFLVLSILPINLHMRRGVGEGFGTAVAAALIVALLAFFILYLKNYRRVLIFSFCFFLISLIPFIFVIGHFNLYAEHWLYLPGVGIFLFISTAAVNFYTDKGLFAKLFTSIILLAFVVSYPLITINQNKYWQTDTSLSDRVLSFSGVDDVALFYKVFSNLKKGDFADMDSYVKSNPNDPDIWFLKGRWEMTYGNIDAAEEDFKKALEINQNSFNGYFGLGLVAFVKGEPQKGIEYLLEAIKINPKSFDSYLILGAGYSKLGEDEKALEAAKKAEGISPYDFYSLINLGTAYTRLGKVKQGAEYYYKATQLYPERPLGFYNLAEVFYRCGERHEAEKCLEEAIMFDPSYKPAIELLQKIKSDK